MRISVVVPSYRRADQLDTLLDRLEHQVTAADEVVVVCRATDTDTHLVLAGHADLPLRPVEPSEAGFVPALRAGIAAASGDVVVCTDDDAEPGPGWLSALTAPYQRPEVVAVGGRDLMILDGVPQVFDSRGGIGTISWLGRVSAMHSSTTGYVGPVEHLRGVNMSFRAPVPLPDTGLIGDGSYNEIDICQSIRHRGVLWYDASVVIDHRLGVRRDPGAQGSVVADRDGGTAPVVRIRSYNLAFVLSKHTVAPAQRAARLAYLLLVGQRDTWGLARAGYEALRTRQPRYVWLALVAVGPKLRGWRAGGRARTHTG